MKREFKFPDFYRAMSFVNAVAHIANIEDHHPDIECGWGYCRIRYQTHAIGGLHENDFICAAKIDRADSLRADAHVGKRRRSGGVRKSFGACRNCGGQNDN